MIPTKQMPEKEFIALAAMLFATIAFTIDAMLPALGIIGTELSPADPERATLIVGVFILGMGIGTLFAGALSDAFGRKPVIVGSYLFFIGGALVCALAPTLELMLFGRLIQGLAVAGPRVAGQAMIRDLYSGPKMASIMSLTMMIFGLVPAIAPLLGQAVMSVFGWRAIFVAVALFGVIASLWLLTRQPETLAVENRQPMRIGKIIEATKYALSNRVFRFSVAVQTFLFGSLISMISTVHPIYDQVFDRGEEFPLWFGLMAVLSMPASFANSRIVAKTGMRAIIQTTLYAQLVIVGIVGVYFWTQGHVPFPLFFVWNTSVFIMVGFTFGNLTTLAMEPMGKIAGLAASILGAVSTVFSVAISIPVSQMFDGTPRTLILGVFGSVLAAVVLMLWLGPRRPSDLS